jgi:hypothetical protein
MKTLCSLVLLSVVTATHAQDCGGMANAGGTCVPPDVAMPSYQQQAPQPPPQKWVDHYGAIATDEPRGVLGASTDMPDRQSAENAAMENCRVRGGINCTMQISYGNQCVALVVGGKGFAVNSGATVAQATEKGMKFCTPMANDCHAYYTACSLPARIQ